MVNVLPNNPSIDNEVTWSPTNEVARYAGDALWRRMDGAPLATVFDDFDGPASTPLDGRAITYFRFGTTEVSRMGWSRVDYGKILVTDGSGRAMAKANNTAAGLAGPLNKMIVPRGCTNCIIKMLVILNADNVQPDTPVRVSPLEDGTRAVYVRFTRSTLSIEEHQIGVDTAPRTLASTSFTAIDHLTTAHELTITRQGTSISALCHTNSATVSASTQYQNGRFAALSLPRTTSKVLRFMVYPLDTDASEDAGEGAMFRGVNTVTHIPDCDVGAIQLNSAGLYDVLTAASTNSAGQHPASFYHLSQEVRGAFRRKQIDANVNSTTQDRFAKLEGACFLTLKTLGATGYVLIDQGNPTYDGGFWFYLADDLSNPYSTCSRVRLNLDVRKYGQQAIAWDIDGDGQDEVLVFYEGFGAGTAAENGGIVAYKWNGGDPLDQASWTEQLLLSLPGCWCTTKRARLLDLDDDGIPESLIVAARDSRNPDGMHGIFAATAGGFASWGSPIMLYDAGDGNDVYNPSTGNFFAGDKGRSIAFCLLNDPHVHFIDFTNAWSHSTVSVQGDWVWNLMPIELPAATRTPLVVATGYRDVPNPGADIYGGGFYLMTGPARTLTLLMGLQYEHPSEKPDAPVIDYYGDAGQSIVMYNSGGQSLQTIDFARSP